MFHYFLHLELFNNLVDNVVVGYLSEIDVVRHMLKNMIVKHLL